MAGNFGPTVRNPFSDNASNRPHAGHGAAVLDQDRLIPVANVHKIMKRALPEYAKVSEEANEAVQECVTKFISFVTRKAIETCQMESRKIISGDDIIWAMNCLGFFNYAEVLSIYLRKCRMFEKAIKSTIAKKRDASAIEADTSIECIPMTAGQIGATNERFAEEFAAGFDKEILPMTVGEIGGTNEFFAEEFAADFDSPMQLMQQPYVQPQPSIEDLQQSPYQLPMPSETDNSGNSKS